MQSPAILIASWRTSIWAAYLRLLHRWRALQMKILETIIPRLIARYNLLFAMQAVAEVQSRWGRPETNRYAREDNR